ncbi:MAG: NAD(P)H-hydrate epimerase [Candidatus Omnitrophica bacterium]|nr:NAD(P)H-hydrate epimerase [Candidatus Omnitrophota bacterium]
MKYVTASEMQEIDRRAIEEFGIPSILLMENAGRAVAEEVQCLLKGKKDEVAIFCGKGNNGGDGFVAARHLANQGTKVHVVFFQSPSDMKPDPLVNFKILQKMNVSLIDCSVKFDPQKIKNAIHRSKVVVDALFGTGLSKPIEGNAKEAIDLMNALQASVVAVDIPSGLNADTGKIMGICVEAKITITLGLPKKAFCISSAKELIGKVVVADISIPRELLN